MRRRPGQTGLPIAQTLADTDRYEKIDIMMPSDFGTGRATATSGWAARVANPRVLILASAALVLTNIPLTHYPTSQQPDYFWSSLGVLVAAWQLWDHRRLAWVVFIAGTAASLPLYALSVAGVTNYLLPGWWMLVTGTANILALVIFLSPPIRRWVAQRPAPVL